MSVLLFYSLKLILVILSDLAVIVVCGLLSVSTCICVIMADYLRSSELDRLLLESGRELSG